LEPTASTDTAAISVVPDRDGGLWTWLRRSALMRLQNGSFENALNMPGPPDPRVGTMATGRDGTILIADMRLGLVASRDGHLTTVVGRDALPRRFVTAIAETPNRDIWLGTRDAGLVHVTRAPATTVDSVPLKEKINCLVADGQDGLWIGTD